MSDPTATVFADLRTNVYNFWDRGLLGLALDPAFPSKPYVYVLYTYDHVLGSAAPAPRWGTAGASSTLPIAARADSGWLRGQRTTLPAARKRRRDDRRRGAS